MKTLFHKFLIRGLMIAAVVLLFRCDDDDGPSPQLTGDSKQYTLSSVSDPAISGTVTFAERDDDQTVITIQLNGTQPGSSHPAHIHANSAAAGGSIVLDLEDVDGADGKSETVVNALNDGTPVTYGELLDFNGYVNVHLAPSDLGTLIAQGDIGGNELTGDKKVYTFEPVVDPNVSGTATFAKRKNGSTLVTVDLENKQPTADHASHIHANTIAQGGSIVINLKNVNGTTGFAASQVDSLNNGTPITYEELLNFNGYLNVHQGASFVGQADIGANELTGDRKEYEMTPVENPAVQGKAIFEKRKKGTTLVTIMLEGQEPGLTHASHFHANTVADTGPIVINLKSVNSSMSVTRTSVDTLNNGNTVTYEDLLNFNGYINVHKGSTFVVQVDIGQNELTGDHQHYTLNDVGGSGVSGMATFDKRKNGKTQVMLQLDGTTAGASHPAHIHTGNAATGGPIAIDLKNVVGATGLSLTNVTKNKDDVEISYDQLVNFDGHINVHLSATELSTVITQGNIGANAQ